jgi:hypothetical protein
MFILKNGQICSRAVMENPTSSPSGLHMHPDQVEKLKGFRRQVTIADMIVMGGGAWDRLHKYSTDDEKENVISCRRARETNKESLRDVGIL